MRPLRSLLLLFALALTTAGQEPPTLASYLPADVDYDPRVLKPADFLGYEVGEWHVRHDQLVGYCGLLAQLSNRVKVEVYARTHEARPLLLLTVTSPRNHARLDELRAAHVELTVPSTVDVDLAPMPVVVQMGYSVHGNESSGSNAALLFLYHLVAARGPAIDALLDDMVILVDPCLNPDGLSRFAQWANTHKGRNLIAAPEHREHREEWPGGRTNHYWFDLNRDWLLLTHPESRGRVERFHHWKPNVVTDFHEMGTNASYFFQPGVRSRGNPLTPPRNFELTAKIAGYHARALDRMGSLYFTEEQFDDFYYGKGSTYPDVHGSIGILFEQASSRGHVQRKDNGQDLTFPFTIKNQFRTSLSTIQAAHEMRVELLTWQRDFYRTARFEAAADRTKAYVFGEADDAVRTAEMIDLLRRHRIEVHRLGRAIEGEGQKFAPASAYVVSAAQPQYRLVKTFFERRTKFLDETFYDVSAWTLPLAFDVPYRELEEAEVVDGVFGARVGDEVLVSTVAAPTEPQSGPAYAYAFSWSPTFAPRALFRLLAAGVRARVATSELTVDTTTGPQVLGLGAIVVTRGDQSVPMDTVRELVAKITAEDHVPVLAVTSGLTPSGVDVGSSSLRSLEQPKVLLAVGSGISSYDAGEVWHLLDVRFDMPVTMVETGDFDRLDFGDYTHLVLAGGLDRLSDGGRAALQRWTRAGGVILAMEGATSWVERQILEKKPDPKAKPNPPETSPEEQPFGVYADLARERAGERVPGTIFRVRIDVTHPMGYGFRRDHLAVFRSSASRMELESDRYANVAVYTADPLLAGYCSKENEKKLAGSASVIAQRVGRGAVVRLADDPDFRGYWRGTERLVMNALFFATIARNGSADEGADDEHGHDH